MVSVKDYTTLNHNDDCVFKRNQNSFYIEKFFKKLIVRRTKNLSVESKLPTRDVIIMLGDIILQNNI